MTGHQHEAWAVAYKDGASIPEIASAHNAPLSTVRKALIRLGAKMRTRDAAVRLAAKRGTRPPGRPRRVEP
jgi:hypothetical protein